jgi:hypothetical protein
LSSERVGWLGPLFCQAWQGASIGKPSFRLISKMSSSLPRATWTVSPSQVEGSSVSAWHSQLASRGLQTYVSARRVAAALSVSATESFNPSGHFWSA